MTTAYRNTSISISNRSSLNHGSASSEMEDYCCCFVDREHFEATATAGVYVLNSIVLCLTSVSATIGNFLVLVSIWRSPSLHSPANVLIFGLALSDLGVGLIVEPAYFIYGIAQFGGFAGTFCTVAVLLKFAGTLIISASLITVTVISLDMYLALYLHLRYQELVTMNRMIAVQMAIWVCSIAASLLSIWYFSRLLFFWASAILLCLLVTTVAYFKVLRIVRQHQIQIYSQSRAVQQPDEEADLHFAQQKKSSMTKFLIYCLLVVCHLPHSVMLAGFKSKDTSASANSIYQMSFVLVCLNSSLNPFIYCWRFHKIRTAVIDTTKKMLRRHTASPL